MTSKTIACAGGVRSAAPTWPISCSRNSNTERTYIGSSASPLSRSPRVDNRCDPSVPSVAVFGATARNEKGLPPVTPGHAPTQYDEETHWIT